jgi:hypothetical protein
VSAHDAKRHVCAPEGGKMARTPLAAFFNRPRRGKQEQQPVHLPVEGQSTLRWTRDSLRYVVEEANDEEQKKIMKIKRR